MKKNIKNGNNIYFKKNNRTEMDRMVEKRYRACWDSNKDSFEVKMEMFPKYIKRQSLTRFLALYDIFKKILDVKGSIIECGVKYGRGLMTWAKLSSILEPINIGRKIFGFDTFEGFPSISKEDLMIYKDSLKVGDMCSNSYYELKEIIKIYNTNRPIGHIEKVYLIKGDANKTIPKFIEKNPYIIVSLLRLDFNLYKPTSTAIKHFYPRIPKGGIIIFDDLDSPMYPGETVAMIERLGVGNLRLQRINYEPFMAFAVKE